METTAVKVAENKYMYINPDAYAELIELMDNEKKYPHGSHRQECKGRDNLYRY